MLKALGSRLTYANVVATGALFVALGGGAYALSGVPDRGGVFHGCVATSGALRVVKGASSCRKTKTVRRGGRRVRILGESAIAWNQQGPRGLQGLQGNTGLKGDRGPTGPTQGVAAQWVSGAIPSNTPDDSDFMDTTVTTPTSGKLFAFARGSVAVTCTAGTGVQLGMYVDGTPVHASGRAVTAAVTTAISLFGLSDTVSAGTHKISVGSDCTGGNTSTASVSADGAVGGILVGS